MCCGTYRALRYLEDSETGGSEAERMQLLEAQTKCANNLAAAQLKVRVDFIVALFTYEIEL